MAFRVGTITVPLSTGQATFTITDFPEPKALILFTSSRTADGVTTDARIALGAAVSSTKRATIAAHSADGAASSSSTRYHTNQAAIVTRVGGTNDLVADFVSFGTSGSDATFTLNFTTVPGTAIKLNYIAIAGDDVEANLLEVDNGTTSVAHELSGEPTCVIAFGISQVTPTGFGSGTLMFSVGVSDHTTSRTLGIGVSSGQADSQTCRISKAALLTTVNADSIFEDVRLTSSDDTNLGLTWDARNSPGNRYMWLLCLRGVRAKVGAFNTPTSGSGSPITGVGFEPGLILPLSFMGPAASGVQDHARLMIGADDGTNAAVAGVLDEDAQPDTDADRFQDSDTSIQIYDHAQTLLAEGSIASFDSDGFTPNFGTVDSGTAHEIVYLALGDVDDGGDPEPPDPPTATGLPSRKFIVRPCVRPVMYPCVRPCVGG